MGNHPRVQVCWTLEKTTRCFKKQRDTGELFGKSRRLSSSYLWDLGLLILWTMCLLYFQSYGHNLWLLHHWESSTHKPVLEPPPAFCNCLISTAWWSWPKEPGASALHSPRLLIMCRAEEQAPGFIQRPCPELCHSIQSQSSNYKDTHYYLLQESKRTTCPSGTLAHAGNFNSYVQNGNFLCLSSLAKHNFIFSTNEKATCCLVTRSWKEKNSNWAGADEAAGKANLSTIWAGCSAHTWLRVSPKHKSGAPVHTSQLLNYTMGTRCFIH